MELAVITRNKMVYNKHPQQNIYLINYSEYYFDHSDKSFGKKLFLALIIK